jgi:hypothetical protein
MFAHQVIEDVEKGFALDPLFKCGLNEGHKKSLLKYQKKALSFIPTIKKAQKFHGGDAQSIFSLFPEDGMNKIFKGPMTERWRLPYKNFWCDFIWGKGRAGVVAFEIIPNLIGVGFVMKPHISECCFPTTPFFAFLPIWVVVSIGECMSDRTDKGYLMDKLPFLNGPGNGNIAFVSLGLPREEIDDSVEGEVFMLLEAFEKFVYLLNCKNIATEKVVAPERLNKRRRESGKQELFDYHILNVMVPSKKRGYRESAAPLSHNRVHLCRGHFKEYTSEHPLFGHYTGLYWWQPHVRGQNKRGVVMKDYNVVTKESK